MMEFDNPNIKEGKSPEENIKAIRSYLEEITSVIEIGFNQLEKRVDELEKEIHNG